MAYYYFSKQIPFLYISVILTISVIIISVNNMKFRLQNKNERMIHITLIRNFIYSISNIFCLSFT